MFVKEHGTWLKSLKFLGLEISHNPFRIRANTRKGSLLEFTDEISFLAYCRLGLLKIEKAMIKGSASHSTLSMTLKEYLLMNASSFSKFAPSAKSWLLFKSDKLGWFVSRLQWGKWVDLPAQDFRLTFTGNSWISTQYVNYHHRHRKALENTGYQGLNVFNASSLACHSLLSDPHRKSKISYYVSDNVKPSNLYWTEKSDQHNSWWNRQMWLRRKPILREEPKKRDSKFWAKVMRIVKNYETKYGGPRGSKRYSSSTEWFDTNGDGM